MRLLLRLPVAWTWYDRRASGLGMVHRGRRLARLRTVEVTGKAQGDSDCDECEDGEEGQVAAGRGFPVVEDVEVSAAVG